MIVTAAIPPFVLPMHYLTDSLTSTRVGKPRDSPVTLTGFFLSLFLQKFLGKALHILGSAKEKKGMLR